MRNTAPAARTRGWVVDPAPPVINGPNLVTLLRTAAAVPLAVLAIVEASAPLAVAAYLSYWLGDILDGLLARMLGQETRLGAVLDILADRASSCLCAGALLVLRPDMALPITIFLFQFMVLDCLLSLAFLRWPLLSPNYFGLVHRGVYLWNWSPPAKALNTSALVILVLVSPSPLYPAAVALAAVAVKVASLRVVAGLLPPEPLPAPAGVPHP